MKRTTTLHQAQDINIIDSGNHFSSSDVEGALQELAVSVAVGDHEALTGLLGGAANDHYHFTSAQHTDLTDGGDSTLHYHASDRAASIPTDGWIPVSDTWGQTGSYSFIVSGDVTATYIKGAKIRYKDGGAYEYGTILSSSFSSPNTTVTLLTNSDYTMAAATITDKYISYVDCPQGFPNLFNYTPTVSSQTGSPTTVTTNVATFCAKLGSMVVNVKFTITNKGTAADGFYFTTPCNASGVACGTGRENAVVGKQLQCIVDGTGANPNRANILAYDNVTIWVNNYVLYVTMVMGW